METCFLEKSRINAQLSADTNAHAGNTILPKAARKALIIYIVLVPPSAILHRRAKLSSFQV